MKASYTLYELAEVWSCHWAALYRMIKTGKLHAFRVGRTWRIKHEERIRVETSPEISFSQTKRAIERKVQPSAKRRVGSYSPSAAPRTDDRCKSKG